MKKILLVCLVTVLLISSCKIVRVIVFNFADVKEYKKFPERKLTKAQAPFKFEKAISEKFSFDSISYANKKYDFEKFLGDNNTIAFIVIKEDKIVYEKYFVKDGEDATVPSFSVAKSFLSALYGCALKDGLIKSVDEPITNYIPELKKNGFEKVTIKHVLQMTSGIKFSEKYYNPASDVAALYYGRNLDKQITHLKLKHPPGEYFEYKSGNTQLLGLILARALKEKSLTQYLQEKIWTPLGMEFDASWSLDRKNGREKTFCCINAKARDFAKLGRLFLNKGIWNGQEVIPSSWVEESTHPELAFGGVSYYKYQWWFPFKGEPEYMAQGILGQFVYVDPIKKTIVVRLSKKSNRVYWPVVFKTICAKL